MSKEFKSFSMELAGRTLRVDVGRVAAQANGAAFMHLVKYLVVLIKEKEKPVKMPYLPQEL